MTCDDGLELVRNDCEEERRRCNGDASWRDEQLHACLDQQLRASLVQVYSSGGLWLIQYQFDFKGKAFLVSASSADRASGRLSVRRLRRVDAREEVPVLGSREFP